MVKTKQIAGVVLAGGLSTRMGTDKSQLIYQGETLLENAKRTLESSCAGQILVSGGDLPGAVEDKIPQLGPLGGIYSILSLPGINKFDGFLFITVDMPNVNASMLDRLVSLGSETTSPICFKNCYLPLFLPNSKQVKDQLHLAIKQQQLSVKSLFAKTNGAFVTPEDQATLLNVNRMQEWRNFLSEQTQKRSVNL